MPMNLLSLPGELRNKIYSHGLVKGEPIIPWHGDPELAHNLLGVNKTIQTEASSLLYGRNCFDLTPCEPNLISQFFDEIGHKNANHLRSIRVEFPVLNNLEDDVRLGDDSCRVLAKIQSSCSNLRMLIIASHSADTMELKFDHFNSPALVAKALALIDAHFRAIVSLQDIVVEVYEDSPSFDTRKIMESHGWTIEVVERVEHWEEDRSFSDYGDDDHLYDDYDEDDYDTDNDSDLWRRAAD